MFIATLTLPGAVIAANLPAWTLILSDISKSSSAMDSLRAHIVRLDRAVIDTVVI